MRAILLAILLVFLFSATVAAEDSAIVFDGTFKATSITDSYVYWAWRAAVSNREEVARDVRLKIQLIDGSGFELDHRTARVHVGPLQVGIFTGTGMLKKDMWEKVSGANFTIE